MTEKLESKVNQRPMKTKKTISIVSHSISYPIFNEYIWMSIIEKYLKPKDTISLSNTCKRLYILITTKMNPYWHYNILEKSHKLPIHSYKHTSDFIGYCIHNDHRKSIGLPQAWQTIYTNDPNLPLYPEYDRIMREPISDQVINKLNYINKFEASQLFDYGRNHYPSFPRDCIINGKKAYACNNYTHWIRIDYPYNDIIYKNMRSSRINYYQKYIYSDYYATRTKILNRDYDKAIDSLKRAEMEYLRSQKKLNLFQSYMNKYYEDSPDFFTKKIKKPLDYYNIIDSTKEITPIED